MAHARTPLRPTPIPGRPRRPGATLPWLLLPLLGLSLSVRGAPASEDPREVPAAPAGTASQDPSDDADGLDDLEPLLASYCFPCHGPEKQKAGLRLDELDRDLVGGSDAEEWNLVLGLVRGGEMPPRKATQPTDDERRRLVARLEEELERAARANEGEHEVVLRRLTRAQYTNTLQELLGVRRDFGRTLPADARSELGFTNDGAVLQASSLHLETYQELARAALDHAIVGPERPPVSRFRVTFGEDVGVGHVAATTGGYQSVPLPVRDFRVEVLEVDGTPRAAATDEERAALEALQRRVTVGLRGSSQDRFRVLPEGLVLQSALPGREVAPSAWQGPSPNVKLELKRCFPQEGDFRLRVVASRGRLWRTRDPILVALEDPEPLPGATVPVDAPVEDGAPAEGAGADALPEGALVVAAEASDERTNVELRDGVLVPVDATQDASSRVAVVLPEEGFYRFDLLHPALPVDNMPSVRLSHGNRTLDLRPRASEADLAAGRMWTNLGAGYLPGGRQHLKLGGRFFTGFERLVVTPLPADHELVRRLSEQVQDREAAVRHDVPALRAFVGTRTDDGMDYLTFGPVPEVDGLPGDLRAFDFVGRLEDLPIPEPDTGDLEVLSGFLVVGVWNDHLVKHRSETGPPLLVRSMEFEAPYHPVWPPASHTAILFDSPLRETDERAYVAEVLRAFLPRAFRRAVGEAEVERYLAFHDALRPEFERLEDAVREVLVAALCSPSFLFLVEPEVQVGDGPARIGDEALAVRLSYFLWNSPPDAALRELAASGELPARLEGEVDRLLDDPRSRRFVDVFGHEWLRLDRLEGMTLDPQRFPDFTRYVKRDLREETLAFLHHVLVEDRPVFDLVDSDYALLNQNLAEYYGVEGVEGPALRPVPVPPEAGRGGLLTQGAFLVGHSDGREPHPIKRAVWLKEKLLGDPPPPPPPNVPDLDPEAPGMAELTLKEQLEAHRDNPSCHDCHAGLDPYGIVFEGYDASGRRRTEAKGRPVDDASVLPDGTEVRGVAELQAYLQGPARGAFLASWIRHLYGYALGREVGYADEPTLRRIQERVESEGCTARSVLRAIVTSEAFRRP